MKNEMFSFLKNYIRKIKKEFYAYPFLKPVDYVGLKIPTYIKIIKHPMDLETLEKTLNDHEYLTIDQFYNDVMLIWRNCKKFNEKDCPLYKAAEYCEIFTKNYFHKYLKRKENFKNIEESKINSKNKNKQKKPKQRKILKLKSISAKKLSESSYDILTDKISENEEVSYEIENESMINSEYFNSEYQKVHYPPSKFQMLDEIDNAEKITDEEVETLSSKVQKMDMEGIATLTEFFQSKYPRVINETEENIEMNLNKLRQTSYKLATEIVESYLEEYSKKIIVKNIEI